MVLIYNPRKSDANKFPDRMDGIYYRRKDQKLYKEPFVRHFLEPAPPPPTEGETWCYATVMNAEVRSFADLNLYGVVAFYRKAPWKFIDRVSHLYYHRKRRKIVGRPLFVANLMRDRA